jgi:hypothetical protein
MPDASLDPQNEFDDILDAVMESPRGRWFLAEFAARNRTADTERILAELGRLQIAPTGDRPGAASPAFEEPPPASPAPAPDSGLILVATQELDAIVTATESATAKILTAAETIQSLAAALRAAGALPAHCDSLDQEANTILMACAFPDITGRPADNLVHTLRGLEQRGSANAVLAGPDTPTARPGADDATTLIQIEELLKPGTLPALDDLIIADRAPAEAIVIAPAPAHPAGANGHGEIDPRRA